MRIGEVSTVTPSGKFWVLQKHGSCHLQERLLTAVEKFNLQGLERFDAPEGALDRDLSDLAGNAFSAHCCVAMILATLSAIPNGFDWSRWRLAWT